ncbi:MAG: cytochrome c-type biogenesis protein [Planctomycetota bacterium]
MKRAIQKRLSDMTDQEIKAAVADRYGQVAHTPDAKFNFPVGRKFAESVGYTPDLLRSLPAELRFRDIARHFDGGRHLVVIRPCLLPQHPSGFAPVDRCAARSGGHPSP